MGQVFEAQHVHTGAHVAIKTLHGGMLDNITARQRFLREARACVRVGHRNIVEVFDLDMDDAGTCPFIVQEFLVGETLAELLDRSPSQRLDARAALRLLVPVMGALVGAHRRGVVHRDLKPSNIFLCEGNEVTPKLIDFGVAKVRADGDATALTATGIALGSPEYMSPEQVAGDATVDAQSDVWSMGVVLYECVTGNIPFAGTSPQDSMVKVLHARVPPVTGWSVAVDDDLARVIHRALERDRTRRYRTMQSLVEALLETRAWSEGTAPAVDFSTTERNLPSSTLVDDEAATLVMDPSPRPTTPKPARGAWPTWVFVLLGVLLVVAATLLGRALGRAGL